jgi:hypothetical protein
VIYHRAEKNIDLNTVRHELTIKKTGFYFSWFEPEKRINSWKSFHLSTAQLHLYYAHKYLLHFRLMNLFANLDSSVPTWGFGLLQIELKHLLFVSSEQIQLLFLPVWRSRNYEP